MERYFKKIPKSSSSCSSTCTSLSVNNIIYTPDLAPAVIVPEVGPRPQIIIQSNLGSDNENTEESQDEEIMNAVEESSNELPRKKRKIEPRKRYFRNEWVTEFPWLIEKLDAIFCKYCNTSLTKNHAHLKRHQQRLSHQNKMMNSKFTVDVSHFLKENAKKELLSYKTKRAEFKLTMALVEHNLPFLFMDHLPQLLKYSLPDSEILKLVNCARTKVTAMVKVMADESKTNLAHILSRRKFSIIVDETTDISVKKCLAILVRYVSMEANNKVKDQLLSLVEVNDLTAAGIASSTLNVFDNLKIPKSNIIGFAADNASVMMGNFNGVQAKLKESIPNIFVMGCICHSMALCASNAANKLPKEVEDFVRNIYNYLSGSAKRLQEYKEFQDFVAIKPHKVLKLSQTRWLSLEAVVLRILEQWPALTLYFQSAVFEDNLVAAEGILEGLRGKIFKLYLTFLSYIVPLINKINVEFQSEKPKLHIVYDRISTLYRTILKNYMKKSYVDQDGVREENKIHLLNLNPMNVRMYRSNNDLYLGEECALLLLNVNLGNTEMHQFKNYCLSYYIELCIQIKNRFQNLKQYEHFGLLNPKNLLEDTVSLTPLLKEFLHLTNGNIIANWPRIPPDFEFIHKIER